MALGDFLTDESKSLAPPFLNKDREGSLVIGLGSWADEMEDMPVGCKPSLLLAFCRGIVANQHYL